MSHAETVGPGLTSSERDDFEERLHRAVEVLESEASRTTAPHRESRLLGKIEGLKLALDYLRAYDGRVTDQ